jgi:hypothetical protein
LDAENIEFVFDRLLMIEEDLDQTAALSFGMDTDHLPDFPSLQQLANSLWRKGSERGAAVLVGSGFSRNADRAGVDTPKPPLWGQLYRAMARRLYETDTESAPPDALRLAEEFKCYLGRAALDEFIREHVPDAAWRPGTYHTKLMRLPWSDVLTTNWDTLLERASRVHRVVRDPADIPRMPAPRVVKLHGSIDTNGLLVFTEEDFRTYPARFAPFVNLARQVFLENELCLVGFSGDDPNFLQWSGWVRDHLGDSARRIYLVGSLRLSPAKRKLLESRNVAPIDFGPMTVGLSEDDAAALAMGHFLEFLRTAEPKRRYDWRPKPTSEYGFQPFAIPGTPAPSEQQKSAMLDTAMEIWRADREGYPHWLICPTRQRAELWYGSRHLPTTSWALLEAKPLERRALFLYELAWRHSKTLCSLDEQLIVKLREIADPGKPCGLKRDQQLEVAVLLLREARISRKPLDFEHAEALLARETTPGSDGHTELIYQRLLWKRDEFDYRSVSVGLKDLKGDDPVWKLRRACLHWDCGESEEAKSLLQGAIVDLDERQRHDPSSIWVGSRSSWAAVIARAVRIFDFARVERDDRSGKIAEIGCDPDDELENLRHEAEEKFRTLSEPSHDFEPSFGAGSYKKNSSSIVSDGSDAIGPAAATERLADVVGLPMRMPHVDVLAEMSMNAGIASFEPSLVWHLRLLRSVNSHTDRAFQNHFGRAAIARLDPLVARDLTKYVLVAVRFWRDRARQNGVFDVFVLERLRVFIETLSRLVPRSDEETILSALDLAAELAQNPLGRHHWMYEVLANLTEHSLRSLSRAKRGSLVLNCLRFPLPDENPWSVWGPNPISHLFSDRITPQRSPGDPRWRVEVNTLIERAKDGPSRGQAVERLAYLCHYDALEGDESENFRMALWSKTDDGRFGFPADIGLFPNRIIGLPAPAGTDPLQIVRTLLYTAPLRGSDLSARLPGMVVASACLSPFTRVQPTPDDAVRILDEILSLDLEFKSADPVRKVGWHRIGDKIGDAIAHAILPNLGTADFTEVRVQFIFAMSESDRGRGVLAGLPWLAIARPDLLSQVAIRLRRAISRGNPLDVQAAAKAIETWARSVPKASDRALPESVVNTLVSAVEAGRLIGLQPLLWCTRRLFEDKFLLSEHVSSVESALGDLLKDLSYGAMPVTGPEAIGLTIARAECVRLSHALIEAGQSNESTRSWIDLSANDPLPEVRLAIETP